MILAKKYIKTGFSIDDANKIQAVIAPLIEHSDTVEINFADVNIFTTLFFNNALTRYVMELGPDIYDSKILVTNLSDIGKVTYAHSLENAKNYFKLTMENRKQQDEIVTDISDLED